MTGRTKHSIVLFLVMFLIVSCQDVKKMERPKDLIPEAKMIDVLTELSIVQAARNYNKTNLERIGVMPDEYVYNKFDIDSLQLQRSISYYSENYIQYDRMYDSVKARVQLMKNRLDSLRTLEIKIEDSIKLAKKDSIRLLDSLGIKNDGIPEEEIKEINKKDSLLLPPSTLGDTSEN